MIRQSSWPTEALQSLGKSGPTVHHTVGLPARVSTGTNCVQHQTVGTNYY
uniref:Uncharacterized protein n=1 Tax=Anguilla anguilla TaxID=7936 RepID=A0A0E9XRA1_ANGAN